MTKSESVVKRIWTPSWAIFSAGWAAVFLAFFYYVIDVRGWRRWAFPFLVVGMNSIAMYVIVHVAEGFMRDAFRTHLGRGSLQVFGAAQEGGAIPVYGQLMAAALVCAAPVVILYLVFQRFLIGGLTALVQNLQNLIPEQVTENQQLDKQIGNGYVN